MFEIEQAVSQGAKIKVVGVGGSGCNAVNTMIRMGLEGVEFVTANTDRQALDASLAPTKLAIGQELTKGLGAGANPEVGRKAALEDYARISELLHGADMVFITAGMGGGTGTGAAPVFAKIAKEIGALTVGVVTKPFQFEGKKRMKHATQGIAWLRENVDSLIMIPNQRLVSLAGATLSMVDAFKKADEVLLNAVQGISDLINHTGLINSDFADVRTIMQNKGLALMGIGYGEGEHRAVEAATNAISSPLLEDVSIEGATGVIINITGGSNLKTHEVSEATTLIMEAAHEDAEIIFGTVIDDSLKDQVKVTVIATGLGNGAAAEELLRADSIAQQARPAQIQVPQSFNAAAPVASAPAIGTGAMAASAQPIFQSPVKAMQEFDRTESSMEALMAAEAQKMAHDTAEAAAVNPIPPAPNADMLRRDATANDLASLSSNTHTQETDVHRARSIAQRLGITNLTDDEYDVPTYMRRQSDREL